MNATLSPVKLTSKEIEILILLQRGKMNKEIADVLFISIDTVKKHMKSMFRKLEARNRIEAIIRGSEYINS